MNDAPSPKSQTNVVPGVMLPGTWVLLLAMLIVNGPHESTLVTVNAGKIESALITITINAVSADAVQPFGLDAINEHV